MEDSIKTLRIRNFKEFYPFYLTQHSKPITRFFHFVGTFLVLTISLMISIKPEWWMLFLIPVSGYGFAWIGHFVFEKNKPATFKYPIWSLASDFVMFWDMITFQVNKKLRNALKK